MDPLHDLRDELRRSLHGPAWHGPALLEALADVGAAEAAARPVAGAHGIGELALHALAWTEEVTRRLGGGAEPALPARGDWPAFAAPDEAAWRAVREELARAGEALDGALAAFAPGRLEERVGAAGHDPPLGSGLTYAATLHGLAQHNAYHGGQVALLKRALRPAGAETAGPAAP